MEQQWFFILNSTIKKIKETEYRKSKDNALSREMENVPR